MTATGTIAWYSARRGFGFIAPDKYGRDLIVHASEFSDLPLASVRAGMRVSFEAQEGEAEPEAVNLVVLGRAARRA